MGQGAWRDLAHGSSSTGYAKEEGRSHLEDQLDQPVEFLNSTGQASTRSSWKSKSNPKNVASPLTSFDPKPNPLSSTLGKGWLGIEKPNIKRSLDTRSFKS
ncbi:unnamed protein product [Microthlaspi erraticum]|uniref:Uncharacterized protein n=1 Tax=Microthlaspi erraticum TaxID=1685480 RepID=A0A6D2KVC6_9BRAS|nr:unnamed protein product [Microthlaspi erraticum]